MSPNVAEPEIPARHWLPNTTYSRVTGETAVRMSAEYLLIRVGITILDQRRKGSLDGLVFTF